MQTAIDLTSLYRFPQGNHSNIFLDIMTNGSRITEIDVRNYFSEVARQSNGIL